MADSVMSEAYRNADNGSSDLIGISWALLALSTVFFTLFLVSRYYNESGIGRLMLWLIVVSFIFNVGNDIVNALSAILGDAGKHAKTLNDATLLASGKIGKAADYLYIPSAILPKLAMLAFYFQVFPGKIYRWVIYSNASLLVCTLLAGLLQCTFICWPFAAYWTGEGHCGNLITTYQWLSYPNLLTDLVMLVMPFPVLLKLQVNTATKIKLIATFLTGSLGIITAILRMVSFYKIPIFTDVTWYLIEPSIYSVVEPSAYLICAIMPTLRYLTRRIATLVGIHTSMEYTSYGRTNRVRSRRSVLNNARSKNRSGKGQTVDNTDSNIEMQRIGERNGWKKITTGGAQEDIESCMNGIQVKTDVNVSVERARDAWEKGNEVEVRAEDGSSDGKSLIEGRDGFTLAIGDEVPLRKGSNAIASARK